MDEQEKYVNSLPKEIQNSILWYTDVLRPNHVLFNKILREKGNLSPEQKIHFDNIYLAFQGCPPLKNPIVVYKGKDSERIYSGDLAFVSTSVSRKETETFRNEHCCILKITVPPGSKILPISSISFLKEENEVLLNRNGTYSVTGSDIIDIKEDYPGKKEPHPMKIIYCVYSPENSQTEVDISEIKDPGVKDANLIQEQIIKYFSQNDEKLEKIVNSLMSNDEEEFDEKLEEIIKTEKIELDELTKNAIKLRVRLTQKESEWKIFSNMLIKKLKRINAKERDAIIKDFEENYETEFSEEQKKYMKYMAKK